MFDILANVRRAWNEGNPILISNSLTEHHTTTMVYPGQYITPDLVRELRNHCSDVIHTVISHPFSKSIGLPYLNIIYETVRTRYPILDQLAHHGSIISSGTSLSIQAKTEDTSNVNIIIAKTLQELADLSQKVNTDENLTELFSERFDCPGLVELSIAHHSQLRKKHGHHELSIALADISNHEPVVAFSYLLTSDGDYLDSKESTAYAEKNNYVLITEKTIYHLWRSIKKIDREELSENISELV